MLPSDDRQADVQALLDDGDFEEDVVPLKMKGVLSYLLSLSIIESQKHNVNNFLYLIHF